jgi:hypothetical protein
VLVTLGICIQKVRASNHVHVTCYSQFVVLGECGDRIFRLIDCLRAASCPVIRSALFECNGEAFRIQETREMPSGRPRGNCLLIPCWRFERGTR